MYEILPQNIVEVIKEKEFVKNKLTRSYQKLSREGQKELKERFNTIMNVLFIE